MDFMAYFMAYFSSQRKENSSEIPAHGIFLKCKTFFCSQSNYTKKYYLEELELYYLEEPEYLTV